MRHGEVMDDNVTHPALGTVEFVCGYAQLSRATIYRLLADGAFESILVGRSRRIVMISVDAWIQEQMKAQG